MATTTTTTNKPLNPRAQDLSPKGYNRANIFSGKALDFDGVNDYVQCANQSTLSTSSFTITYVAKFNAIGDNFAVTQGGASANAAVITGRQSSNVIRFAFFGNDLDAPTSLTPAVGEWCVLAFTYDRTTNDRKIFINGRLAASDVSAADPSPTANNFRVSSYEAIGGHYSNNVSNVKLFNTALTPAQVADLYLNPEKITPDGVATSALKLWLPMMEGAGASAYDGSGNGNDGTINGATWTAGVGAPVAQTALVSWNKGTNLLQYSGAITTNANFLPRGFSVTATNATSPIGTSDAFVFTENNTDDNAGLVYLNDLSNGNSQTFKVWLKADRSYSVALATNGNVSGGNISLTTSWAEYSVTQSTDTTSGPHVGGFATIARNSGLVIYMWHPQLSYGASPYIKTNATAQTSAVLVPEGLTAGASIFGTDIITPRNAFALNLDGASWAQVLDNSSLDVTTAVTLEAWYNFGSTANRGILGKWDFSGSKMSYLLLHGSANTLRFYVSANGAITNYAEYNTAGTIGTWYHVVGIDNGTNILIYVNGTQVGTASSYGSLYVSDKNIEIGRHGYGAIGAADGDVANPRIYNRALTAAEVLRNYNADKAKFGL